MRLYCYIQGYDKLALGQFILALFVDPQLLAMLCLAAALLALLEIVRIA